MSTTFERIDLDQYDGHTPGPWDSVSNGPGQYGRRIFSDNQYLGSIGDSDQITPAEPNAALIAAAPDMLAALRAAYAEIDRLSANALVWVTVTDDPATLPGTEDKVLVISRGTFTAHRVGNKWYTGMGAVFTIETGDRWAYIPNPDEVPA